MIATAGWISISASIFIIRAPTSTNIPLLITTRKMVPPNFMMRNQRDGTFRDVTAQTGLDKNNTRYSFCCGWSDYNRDGWPDLYVVNDFGRKNLYRNNGDGTFTITVEPAAEVVHYIKIGPAVAVVVGPAHGSACCSLSRPPWRSRRGRSRSTGRKVGGPFSASLSKERRFVLVGALIIKIEAEVDIQPAIAIIIRQRLRP